jgi:hypothetical protein
MSASSVKCPNCDSVRVTFLGHYLSVPIHDEDGQPSVFVFNHVCRCCDEEFLARVRTPVMPSMQVDAAEMCAPIASEAVLSEKASTQRGNRMVLAGQLSLLEGLTAPAILCA